MLDVDDAGGVLIFDVGAAITTLSGTLVDVDDVREVVTIEIGAAEKVVVARSLVILVAPDGEGVRGGIPKMVPVVGLTKLASMPVSQGFVTLSLPHHHSTVPGTLGQCHMLDHMPGYTKIRRK